MRWIHAVRGDAEQSQRDAIEARIRSFWDAWAGRERDIAASFTEDRATDSADWMRQHFDPIHPHLEWEFGPALRDTAKHRLVITTSRRRLRPLVQTILKHAPAGNAWEFYAHHPPVPATYAAVLAKSRTGQDLVDPRFVVAEGEGSTVDVEVLLPRLPGDEDVAMNVAYVAVQSLLGEEKAEHWLGRLRAAPARKSGRVLGLFGGRPDGVSADEFPMVFDAAIETIRGKLPAQPYFRQPLGNQGRMYKMERPRRDDYPGFSDLWIGTSLYPDDIWMSLHGPWAVYSERFSRCGETFCYLKIDGVGGLENTKWPDRSSIEDELHEAMETAGCGGVLGGGTGHRYSYIDIALVDFAQGIDVVRRTLAAGNMKRECWLLFFDDDLIDEWIGVRDDTPPPPPFPEDR